VAYEQRRYQEDKSAARTAPLLDKGAHFQEAGLCATYDQSDSQTPGAGVVAGLSR
jgi:hypothetical protein